MIWVADVLALSGKQLTDRPRPFISHPEQDPIMRTPFDLSFPSGHAATSFAGAALLGWAFPRLRVQLFVVAAADAQQQVAVRDPLHQPLAPLHDHCGIGEVGLQVQIVDLLGS